MWRHSPACAMHHHPLPPPILQSSATCHWHGQTFEEGYLPRPLISKTSGYLYLELYQRGVLQYGSNSTLWATIVFLTDGAPRLRHCPTIGSLKYRLCFTKSLAIHLVVGQGIAFRAQFSLCLKFGCWVRSTVELSSRFLRTLRKRGRNPITLACARCETLKL